MVSPCVQQAAWLARRQCLQQLASCGVWFGGAVQPVAAHSPSTGGQVHAARRAPLISAAWAPDGRLWVVGAEAQRGMFVQRRHVSGRGWEPRRFLALEGERVEAGGQSRPKLAFGPHGWVVLAWTRPGVHPYTGDIRAMRSADRGQTFSAPFTVHHDRQLVGHRFESLAFAADGTLHVLWIDKRDRVHGSEAGAAIYRTVSHDGGQTFLPEQPWVRGCCECCRVALAHDAQGQLAAVWRHVFAGGVRDHAWAPVAPQLDVPAQIMRISHDGWQLDACPHHGPSLAAARDGGWHVVWWGEQAGVRAVRYGRLTAQGRIHAQPYAIPDPAAEQAIVVAQGARVAVVWRSVQGEWARLAMGLSDDDGLHFRWRERLLTAGDMDAPQGVMGCGTLSAVCATEETIHVESLG